MKKQFLLVALLVMHLITTAQKIKLVPFSEGYSKALGIENCGDNRLFIVQEEGEIFICDSAGNRNSKPFLDIRDRVYFYGEQGLLGLAFDPNYKKNGFFYVYYTNKSGNTQISRFKVKTDSPDVANKHSEKFILSITKPFTNHNGGCIHFGPDNYLYIGTGDGGSIGDPYNNAQNTQSLLGKMLRIDVKHGSPYAIPADNPFVDSPNYKPEIWALGLRNPWRWSFDALDGRMFIADVGQASWEEIDIQQNGKGGHNYGWRCYEGMHVYDTSAGCKKQQAYFAPKYEYYHNDSTGDCSVTGGYVYRGSQYSNLYGKYIFTDYCSGLIRILLPGSGQVKVALDGHDLAYTSFGVDKNNEIYVCDRSDNKIYHVTDANAAKNFSSVIGTPVNNLNLSPNPSKGNIIVKYTSFKSEKVTIRITGLLGNELYSAVKDVNTGVNSWNINLDIPEGNYYLTLSNNNGNIVMQNFMEE